MGEPKELPIGIGVEFKKERSKERLPAVEVDNKVIWVNPAFKEAPFNLKEGEPTPFGLFLTNRPEEKDFMLMIMPEEGTGRSAFIGSVIFQDEERRLYRDIDIKGIGYFLSRTARGDFFVSPVQPKPKEREASGLHDYQYASRDRRFSEEFLKAGIRTYRIVAMVEPKEILDHNGKKVSIEKAKELGMVPKIMEPIFEIRAFGTKERIAYLGEYSTSGPDRRALALKDARTIVAQELGLNLNDFSVEDYLKWFAKTLGQEIAKIKKLGIYHGYLTNHNITLDCRIVDLDSVEYAHIARKDKENANFDENDLYRDDYGSAISTLRELVRSVKNLKQTRIAPDYFSDIYTDIYKEAYEEELKKEKKIEEE